MAESLQLAGEIASGPTFAHAMTKKMLHAEWNMSIDAAIDAEAEAQADLHADRGFPPRLPRVRGEAEAAVRGKLTWPCAVAASLIGRSSSRHIGNSRSRLDAWADAHLAERGHAARQSQSVDAACRDSRARARRRRMDAIFGALRRAARGSAGLRLPQFDVRALALIRETLAWHDGLADFAFAMQGLGSGAISLAGSPELKDRYLRRVAAGEAIAAFALSEPQAGSDVAALQCSARLDGDAYVLDGEKTWISNGGIADFYCVFARTQPAERRADGSVTARGISAFVVDAGTPGFDIKSRIDVIAPHPLATLSFSGCRIPLTQRLGAEGEGFKLAMRTLDIFRTSVAGAALGFAQRALDEALKHSLARPMFGKTLADLQLTQAALSDMATDIDAARLLTYRAAWLRDRGAPVTQGSRDGQDVGHRVGAAHDRPGGADVRRPRRRAGRDCRAALPRHPRAAHL